MRIGIGYDERIGVANDLVDLVSELGHEPILLVRENGEPWPGVGRSAAAAVQTGRVDTAIACCWTGTGVSIAANKVHGVRAALCTDAATASGARQWNDANVLCLSLRTLSAPVAKEILGAWLSTQVSEDDEDIGCINELRDI